jgi:hypothetical protein
MKTALTLFAVACLLAGCASSPARFVRADGQPADDAKVQLVLAQCKGEGARALLAAGESQYVDGAIIKANREVDIVSACMAKHGYLAQ